MPICKTLSVMKNKLIILAICFYQGVLGQNIDSTMSIIKSTDIGSIKTNDEHKEFLINIYTLDQEIRKTMFLIEQEFGFRSPEYDSCFYLWMDVDRLLFNTTVEYLKFHSFPKKDLGRTACYTPILIFHHVAGTPEDLTMKKEFFPLFYIAYKNESITSGDIWFYLNRLYDQILKKEYSNYEIGEVQQIEELVEILELKRN